MVGHGNRGKGTGSGEVRKLDYINEKLVYRSTCDKLPAESTDMWQRYMINRSENRYISGSEIEMAQSFWMQLCIHTNDLLPINNDYMIICTKLLTLQQQLGHVYGERQRSVNNF